MTTNAQKLDGAPFRRWLGSVLGLFVRVWLASLRVRVIMHSSLADHGDKPWVLAFHHGKQWPLLAWKRRRPTVVMVSLSRDGELQSGALHSLGLRIVRGSSSRMASRGLAALIRELRRGPYDAAFAVDGPRGPYGTVHGGAMATARAVNGVVVPLGSAMAHGKVFHRAWDRFEVAWPFSRVAVVLGEPLVHNRADAADATAETLANAIEQANRLACQALLVCPRASGRQAMGQEKASANGHE